MRTPLERVHRSDYLRVGHSDGFRDDAPDEAFLRHNSLSCRPPLVGRARPARRDRLGASDLVRSEHGHRVYLGFREDMIADGLRQALNPRIVETNWNDVVTVRGEHSFRRTLPLMTCVTLAPIRARDHQYAVARVNRENIVEMRNQIST